MIELTNPGSVIALAVFMLLIVFGFILSASEN